jgi:hypothetical protein
MSPVNREGRVRSLLIVLILLSSALAGVASTVNGSDSRIYQSQIADDATLSQTPFSSSGPYAATFYETGLPTGTVWYVNLTNGQKEYSTSSSLVFTEPNGSYSYSIATNYKSYEPSPSSGSFVVSGSSLSVYVSFSLLRFPVVFTESNLPTGTKWFVNLSNGQSFNGTSSAIIFNESNGSYPFIIAVGNKIYSPTPSSGQFNVEGSSASVAITFLKIFYRVTFTETGLPSNTEWYVNGSNGTSISSTSTSIAMNLTNGTYTFSISTADIEYYPLTPSLSLRINGQSTSVPVKFALSTYLVSFSESGLPTGTEWFLNITSPSQFNKSYSTTSHLISFNLPNGTYNYSVGNVNQRFNLNQTGGTFVVSGNQVTTELAFLRYYRVVFNEVGLPGGVKWYLNISDPQSVYSLGTNITIREPNGSYHYVISVGNPNFEPNVTMSIGNFSVNGVSVSPAPLSDPIRFYALHLVTFTESRLPSYTQWYLNLTIGSTLESFNSFTSTISFLQPNGTYTYQISTVDKMYKPSPFTGSLKVSGWPLSKTKVNVSVIFYLVTYSVTFTETGLTSGTPWTVTLNNTTRQSINDTVTFDEANGSYQYSIASLSGFNTSVYSGNLTINGTAIISEVAWQEVMYQLKIIQTGISSGTHWSATLQGRTFNGISIDLVLNSTNGSIVFNVPNGTYNYSISPPLGYSGTHVTGTVTIFGESSTAAAFLQAPNYPLIAMVLILIATALVVGLYVMIRRENRSMFKRELTKTERESLLFRKKK